MILKRSDRFEIEIEEIIDFIAMDSPNRALAFYDELIVKINEIPLSPYIYRVQSSSYDTALRELIFKGYTVPFFIDFKKEMIIILGIFNQNMWE
ncbi:MAG TPA: type II toxin-antitoxin system RelE/ParE family toxin [Arcobacter sp.]|nr:type II toxin-antitoxin system RelE/ParE family toxin [Arcobacter sp.]